MFSFKLLAKRTVSLILFLLPLLMIPGRITAQPAKPGEKPLIARIINSGFDLAHDTYNGTSSGSDGRIYYVLCSQSNEIGAQM